ncbi:hypothetical protein [Streptomyces sp. NPDC095613]
MEISKSQVAAQANGLPVAEADAAELIDPSVVVRSEDVEQEECFTF